MNPDLLAMRSIVDEVRKLARRDRAHVATRVCVEDLRMSRYDRIIVECSNNNTNQGVSRDRKQCQDRAAHSRRLSKTFLRADSVLLRTGPVTST